MKSYFNFVWANLCVVMYSFSFQIYFDHVTLRLNIFTNYNCMLFESVCLWYEEDEDKVPINK